MEAVEQYVNEGRLCLNKSIREQKIHNELMVVTNILHRDSNILV